MDAREELICRIVSRRRAEIGELSAEALEELRLAVAADPAGYAQAPEEASYLALGRALGTYEASRHDDDLLDDEEYLKRRSARLAKLAAAAQAAAETCPTCSDARLIAAIADDKNPDGLLDALLAIEHDLYPAGAPQEAFDLDEDVAGIASRPWLRLKAAIARTCLDGARAKMAIAAANEVFEVDPGDSLGARYTAAIAYARLEDEEGFDALDARFAFHGNTWSNLARVILLYKLGRMSAARRALRGFNDLSAAGAYALLRPCFVELYLPDRPQAAVGSLDEAFMAVHEADATIVDVPDFIRWAQDQDWFLAHAKSYAEKHDLDW